MLRVSIDLDYDQVHNIVVDDLVSSYNIQLEERNNEERISKSDYTTLERREIAKQNYKDSKRFVKSLRTVIKYYTTSDQRIKLGLDF